MSLRSQTALCATLCIIPFGPPLWWMGTIQIRTNWKQELLKEDLGHSLHNCNVATVANYNVNIWGAWRFAKGAVAHRMWTAILEVLQHKTWRRHRTMGKHIYFPVAVVVYLGHRRSRSTRNNWAQEFKDWSPVPIKRGRRKGEKAGQEKRLHSSTYNPLLICLCEREASIYILLFFT